MANETNSNDGWNPCPKGTLTGLVVHLKRRERVRRWQQVSSLLAVLLIAVAAGMWFVNQLPNKADNFSYGGITCAEVRQSLPQMMSGNSDESLIAKITAHLAECPHCEEMARRMKEREMHAAERPSAGASSNDQTAIVLVDHTR